MQFNRFHNYEKNIKENKKNWAQHFFNLYSQYEKQMAKLDYVKK